MAELPIDRQLEAQLSEGLRPDDHGAQAFEQAGRHAHATFEEAAQSANQLVAQVDQHHTIQSVAALNTAGNTFEQQAKTQFAQKLAQDPNLNVDDFMHDYVQPNLDSLDDLATTPQSVEHANNLKATLQNSLHNEFYGQRTQVDTHTAVASADNATNDAAIKAYDNPGSLPDILAGARVQVDGLLKAANVPAGLKQEHFDQQDRQIIGSAADGLAHMAETGKYSAAQIDAVQAQIKDPNSPFQKMDASAYKSINDRLDKARQTLATVDGYVAQKQLDDGLRQIKETGEDPNGSVASLIPKVGGSTALETEKMRYNAQREYEHAMTYGKVATAVWTAPEQNLAPAQAAIDSSLAAETDPEKRNGLLAQQAALHDAIAERNREYFKDPGQYTVKHVPNVANAYAAYQQNPTPETFANYATQTAAVQKGMYPDKPVSVVTPEIANEARNAISLITTTPEGAAGAAKQLYVMSQTYGPYWGTISHDLMEQHVLSREQYAAVRLFGDPSKQGVAEQVFQASAMKAGDRFDLHAIPEAKARKAAQAALQPFMDSLGNVNDRGDVAGGFTDAVTHMLQVEGKTDPATAQQIASRIVLDQMQFVGATHTIRAPANLDGDAITSGSEQALNDIDKRDILIPRANSALNPNDQQKNYLRTIQLTGKWYTNEDGSGIKLYDQDGHNVMERVNGRVVPVQMKWSDLTGAKTVPKGTPLPPQPAGPQPFEPAQP